MYVMCLLCVDAVVQAQYNKRRTDMKEERTEEVSLFIAAETVTISCLLWVSWRRSGLRDLIPITAHHAYLFYVALFL